MAHEGSELRLEKARGTIPEVLQNAREYIKIMYAIGRLHELQQKGGVLPDDLEVGKLSASIGIFGKQIAADLECVIVELSRRGRHKALTSKDFPYHSIGGQDVKDY